MGANVGEEEPNIDPEMGPPNKGTWAISYDGEDTTALLSEGETSEDEQGSGKKEEVKETIKEYAIVEGKPIKFVKNDNFRVRAKCVGHKYCPFVVLASKIVRNQPTFAIKTLSLEHECTRVDRLGYCNARWLSIIFAYKIRKNPNWDVAAMRGEVQEQYAMNVSKHQIWRAKRLSRVVIEGSIEQYARLWDYAEQLKASNKGSTVVIKNDMVGEEPVFQRIYVCLPGCKKWFLDGYLKIENGAAWVVISDKKKGLLSAIETIVPTAEHRMCVRHLYSNFRGQHSGLLLKNILWATSTATTIPWYEAEIEKMKVQDNEAYEWLLKWPPKN
ncbi:PREDICTED: uncharacterized protein LOC107880464 [Prunus mume]|uniref:Uncharacterized protein LOC107880464 n=1 Tax=Prunus mume TaxID=102107 RepID=A0ABM1LJ98_PRUMU|nr:PREDICTED: uncharacterized protein LOC107880464 [Prunus mume]